MRVRPTCTLRGPSQLLGMLRPAFESKGYTLVIVDGLAVDPGNCRSGPPWDKIERRTVG